MRRQFAKSINSIIETNPRLIFFTGDLGFSALEEVQEKLGPRFVNVGVAEQNMISMAAAAASKNFISICYSIASFAVFRPFEQIKVDVCLHNGNVKVVGNGGGYGYGIMGATHHALEDIAVMRTLQNMRVFLPAFNSDVHANAEEMVRHIGPCYLRLNSPVKMSLRMPVSNYAGWTKLSNGVDLVIVAAGSILSSALILAKQFPSRIAVWQLHETPIHRMPDELLGDLARAQKLLVLEEHVGPGGIGEALAAILLEMHNEGPKVQFQRAYARGYPSGKYGSQLWHCEENGLTGAHLMAQVSNMLDK